MAVSEVKVMRGVLGTANTPNRWVRLRENNQSVELYVMDGGNSFSAHLTTAEAKELSNQLYELAARIDAPVPIKRDERGRFAA